MNILAIETSCDETAIAIVEVRGDFPNARYTVRAHALFSQADIHAPYGGVFPTLAKREHARRLVPLLENAIRVSGIETRAITLTKEQEENVRDELVREHSLAHELIAFFKNTGAPVLDTIAVTHGPGLEPALWVGVNFARVLANISGIPLAPINHMEGHILASIFDGEKISDISFPALALLISGGHTELVIMRGWGKYEIVGKTRDDAVGEAFDKAARLLGLPYPGGPEISRLAESARERRLAEFTSLPRPMLTSDNLDFSFSGLKTAVLYAVRDKTLTEEQKAALAREFEDAVGDVLSHKFMRAAELYNIRTLIVGGGVIANTHVRRVLKDMANKLDLPLYISEKKLSTDNAIMIALASHMQTSIKPARVPTETITATGNLKF